MATRLKRGTLLQALTANNPWWRDPAWQAKDSHLRAAAQAPFSLVPQVLNDIAPPNLYTLRGPRRVGKTTALKQTIERLCREGIDPRRICFFSADVLHSHTDLINLVQAALQLFPDLGTAPRYFLIDEITAVEQWQRGMKWLRDTSPLVEHCVVVTGSSARDVAAGAEHLAGRRGPATGLDRLLLPLSFAEFLRCSGYPVPPSPRLRFADLYTETGRQARDAALVYLDILVAAFEAYLTIGGFPQAVAGLRQQGAVPEGFARDLWDVVQADLRAAGMTRPEEAIRLLDQVNASLTSRLSLREVAETIGVAHTTVGVWLSTLAGSYLLLHLYQEDHGVPAIDRQRKVYPTDPFIAYLPQRLSESARIPDLSKIAEAALAMAIFRAVAGRALDRFDAPSRLFYYRTSGGGEVDFIVPPGPLAAEAKYIDDPSERETRAMAANFGHGLLITRAAVDDLSKATIMPAGVFCWLMDQGD